MEPWTREVIEEVSRITFIFYCARELYTSCNCAIVKTLFFCRVTQDVVASLSSTGVSVPSPVLGCLFSLGVLTPWIPVMWPCLPYMCMSWWFPNLYLHIFSWDPILTDTMIYSTSLHGGLISISNLTHPKPNSCSFCPHQLLLLPSIYQLVTTLFFQLIWIKPLGPSLTHSYSSALFNPSENSIASNLEINSESNSWYLLYNLPSPWLHSLCSGYWYILTVLSASTLAILTSPASVILLKSKSDHGPSFLEACPWLPILFK